MHLSAANLELLLPFFIALLLSTVDALPRDQTRLADFVAQKPLHTTDLLAGAATRSPRPAMPTTALRSRVMNPPHEDGNTDKPLELLVDRERTREKFEEYVLLPLASNDDFSLY